MRALMGAGLNRMNRYTVRLATTGLAKQIINDNLHKKVVIGYDTRHNSEKFANEAAETLLHYGIKTYVFFEPRPTPMLSYAVRYYGASAGIMIDRKSTRLNSSHVAISYAVFCLKKKNI